MRPTRIMAWTLTDGPVYVCVFVCVWLCVRVYTCSNHVERIGAAHKYVHVFVYVCVLHAQTHTYIQTYT